MLSLVAGWWFLISFGLFSSQNLGKKSNLTNKNSDIGSMYGLFTCLTHIFQMGWKPTTNNKQVGIESGLRLASGFRIIRMGPAVKHWQATKERFCGRVFCTPKNTPQLHNP